MSKKEDPHDKGQKDAREGKFEKPHADLDYAFASPEAKKLMDERNRQYGLGHSHSSGQQDALKGKHSPPHGILDYVLTPQKKKDEYNQENAAYKAGANNVNKKR